MLSHKLSRTKVYQAWCGLKSRCNNISDPKYSSYGAVGITYDPRWEKFEAFLADMGGVAPGLFLDRIDSNRNYCKDNCRWATLEEQASNHRMQHNNTSGVTGVSFAKRTGIWKAYFGKWNTILYQGQDFFEAVCARKSWEANYKGAL